MAKREFKPLLYTTTLRNPLRLKSFLWLLKKFDGQQLTNDLATKICGELIRYELYRPTRKPDSVKKKWSKSDKSSFGKYILSNDEVQWMLSNNPQSHGEAGFDYGWPSRFATQFDFAKELGFVYYSSPRDNGKIEFSQTGTLLARILDVNVMPDDEILVEETRPEYENMAFLQALVKSQRYNPFVKVLNDNVPLILLLEVIRLLNDDPEFNGAGIARHELPLLLFWKDNNAEELYWRIKKLRRDFGYSPSSEVIYDICVNEIMEGNYKKIDIDSILIDYPDDFIRKMRLTGLISIRGAGRFIDINHNEDEKIAYILNNYSSYRHYEDERDYFDYMAAVDEHLFKMQPVKISKNAAAEKLVLQLPQYPYETVKSELEILSKKGLSSHDVLKFLNAPARLEFLTALAIKHKYPDIVVMPNYPCDDEGLPTSTAGGNAGDIECYENNNGILVEVTMSEGRMQTMMEVWPIERHLDEYKKLFESSGAQCVFIAPSLFSDTLRQIGYVKDTTKLIIRPYNITDFIDTIDSSPTLYDNTIA